MAIELPPEIDAMVTEEVAKGYYPSAEVLVARAVRAQIERLRAFRASLDAAEADYRAHGGVDGLAFMADMIARLETDP